MKATKLPVLPGYSFDREIGCTRFHKSVQFEWIKNQVPYLTEAVRPGTGGYPMIWDSPDRYPSIYPRRETAELPAWIAYDKQVLTFDAYFQEAMWEVDQCPYQIRKVKIHFFLEDGTVQVNEPQVDNSGMAQGTLINRQRIRFGKPMDESFFDIIDFNIGKNVELYGRVFKIVNCDGFTRKFLNRLGIFVGDPVDMPEDPYWKKQAKRKEAMLPKKPNRSVDTLGQFLKFDRKVLRFCAYWDDRSSELGSLHKLQLYFYLSDDTLEIIELSPAGSARDAGTTFLKRMKLPKMVESLPGPGSQVPFTVLNVLPTGFLKGKSILDAINCGVANIIYYSDRDLAIGSALNVFNRKVVLCDCDEFTKEYYSTKYGIDTFQPIPYPMTCDSDHQEAYRSLPPYNGYGSYEDSAGNCRTVIPKTPKMDMVKFLTKGQVGLDSHVLKFQARLISVEPQDFSRRFILSYFLMDDTVSVFETAFRNSGFKTQLFIRRREIFKPGQERFVSVKPQVFTKEDFWVGNTVELEGYKLELLQAEEYCLRYMEINSLEFPKSNIKLIMDKIKEKLRPRYKEFICQHLRPCYDTAGEPSECGNLLQFGQMHSALKQLLGCDITEHEIITVARHYKTNPPNIRYTKQDIVSLCRNECKRLLWYGYQRLEENLKYHDLCGSGFVKEGLALSLCRGAKIPIEQDLLSTVFETVERNECGQVSIADLLNFFDYHKGVERAPVPFNHKREFSQFARMTQPTSHCWVDCTCFIKDLGLEAELAKESS